MNAPLTADQQLIEDIAGFTHDPLGYALYAFPWGVKGTELEHRRLRKWQRDFLDGIGERLRSGVVEAGEVIREATASGHGIGKSALVAMLIKWAMDTREDTRGVITANTEKQLLTKTWPELSKWHRMSLTAHWATLTATALISNSPGHDKTWRIDAVSWSEHNTEAFAGLHNEGKRLLLVFDEASAIGDKVWEVAEGALTDEATEIIWAVYGNPTRNTGRFRECFRSERWNARQIDSRTVEGVNLIELQGMVDEYGEDSDVVKVRIRGLFPSQSATQFIGEDEITTSQRRELPPQAYQHAARVVGVDVARHGDDASVILKRQGPWTDKPKALRVMDTMVLVEEIVSVIETWKPDAVFIDATGMGWGVVDRLRQLGYKHIHAVQVGEKAIAEREYVNHRSELWGRMRAWIRSEGVLPDDPTLSSELQAPEYDYDDKTRIRLESKKAMKARGQASPDHADALALTFHTTVAPRTRDDEPDWKKKLRARSGGRRHPMLA